MAIELKDNKFHMFNDEMSYIIEISRQKDLLNSYYGARIDAEDIEIQSNLPGANNPGFYVKTLHKIRGCLTKYVSTQCNNTSKLLTGYSFSSSLHEP